MFHPRSAVRDKCGSVKRASTTSKRERAVAIAAVAGIHAVIVLALMQGLQVRFGTVEQSSLAAFDLTAPTPPPPVEPTPEPAADPREGGAAAPPALEAIATPVVAPPVRLPQPSPVVAAPVAGTGTNASAGATPVPGPGTGGGGTGTGTGSGRGGDGQGGGGGARAERTTGAILDRDYPRSARRARAQGSVTTRFTVGTDGRARGCAVTGSSGNAELDATTCRLIEQRFRYRPARGAGGEAVAEVRGWRQDWWLERRE